MAAEEVLRGRTLGRSCRSIAGGNELSTRIIKVRIDQPVYQWKIAPGHLSVEEVKQFVFHNAAAHACAGLMTCFCRVDAVCVPVGRVEVLIAKEPVTGAVKIVAAAARYGVYYAARGAAVLRRIPGCQDLKLLYRILGKLCRNSRSACVFVIGGVRRVVSVRQERVAAGNSAEAQQSE